MSDDESLKFYIINCGQGLMNLIVFPDKTVMLYDCNVSTDMQDGIMKELEEYIPTRTDEEGNQYKSIDIFVNSHRDTDHIRGLKSVNENFKIGSIWDSGQTGASTDNPDYLYYMQLRRNLKAKDENNLKVPIPSNQPINSYGKADVYCLADSEDYQEVVCEAQYQKIQHTNALVLLIIYEGRKILLTGDSDWKSWKEKIVPNFKGRDCSFEDSDILIASHHGSRSFFTDEANDTIDEEENPDTTYLEAIKMINPTIVLISCGSYETHHHPNGQAVEIYKEYAKNEQVYTTHKENSTFVGVINADGEYAVSTRKFRDYKGHQRNYGFNIVCFDENSNRVESGTSLSLGKRLSFKIEAWGDILNQSDKPRVYWQVSNNGVEKDDSHHEIYMKGEYEESSFDAFGRELSYNGIHLLRCRVINKKKQFDETKIFVVKGVDA